MRRPEFLEPVQTLIPVFGRTCTGASRPGSSDSADAGDGEHAIFHKPPVIAGMPSNPLALLKRLMEQIKVGGRTSVWLALH